MIFIARAPVEGVWYLSDQGQVYMFLEDSWYVRSSSAFWLDEVGRQVLRDAADEYERGKSRD